MSDEAALASGRAGRFRRGAMATLLSQVVHALGQLLLVPVFLAAWGESLYGEWLTLSAVAAQMVLLDLGVQTFVVNRLNQCWARGEVETYQRVLHTALHWCLSLAVIAVAVVAAAAFALPIERWFQLEATGGALAAVVATMLGLQVAATVPYGLVNGIYRTIGEYPTGVMVHNVQRVLFFGLTALVVVLGGGLLHVALAQLVPLVLGLAWTLVDLRRRHPEIRVGIGERERGLARTFLGPGTLFFLIRTSQAATIQGSTLVVSAMFGSVAVAAFATLRTLCNLVRQVAASMVHTLWPELTALEARGEYEQLRGLHRLALKAVTAFSLSAVAFLHFAGADLVELWTSGEIAHRPQLMDAFLALLLLQTPWLTSSIFLMATNRHRPVTIGYVASSALGLGLGILLAGPLGLPGLVLGLLAAELLICGWSIPTAVCELVRDSPRRLFARVLAPGLPIGAAVWLLVALAASGAESLPAGARIVLVGLASVAVTVAATWTLWLDADERARLRTLARPPR